MAKLEMADRPTGREVEATTPYLNLPLRSRAEYEAEALSAITAPFRVPAPMGSHELQLIREHKLQQRFFAAVEEMQAAIEAVNKGSSVITIDADVFSNLAHDEFPSLESWAERLS
jgi:hypothetical protein